jgi:hypothetical protein
MKIEILDDTAASNVWAPSPSPRTALTGTTRHRSQRHRVTNGQAPRPVADPTVATRAAKGLRTAGGPPLKSTHWENSYS